MDKIICLCYDCRELFKEHYRLDAYDARLAKPGEKQTCENCKGGFGLLMCRVRSK